MMEIDSGGMLMVFDTSFAAPVVVAFFVGIKLLG
jgi:hypothetical protein